MKIEEGIDQIRGRIRKEVIDILDYLGSGKPDKAVDFIATNLKEAVILGSSLWLYPFGYIAGRANGSRKGRKTINRPVILVHGFGHNRSAFYVLMYRLRRAGWKNIHTLNLLPVFGGVHGRAKRLKRFVEKIRERTKSEKVDLIGHSLGGIVSRYYVALLDGKHVVNTLVTLGSPNQGTSLSHLGVVGQIPRELVPGNPLLEQLDRESFNGTKLVSIYSMNDWAIHPPRNARLRGMGQNIEIKNQGHLGLLYSKDVFEHIRGSLLGLSES